MTESTQQSEQSEWTVKFVPFASSLDSPFWVRYCQEKLETIQLSESPISIQSSYSMISPPRLACTEESLTSESVAASGTVKVPGTLLGFNTLDSFQQCNKNELLNQHFVDRFLSGDTTCLLNMLLVTFADLKNFKVLYWAAVPALQTAPGKSARAVQEEFCQDVWSSEEQASFVQLMEQFQSREDRVPPYFVLTKDSCQALSPEAFAQAEQTDVVYLGFFDPSGPPSGKSPMGWPLRNLLAYCAFHLGLQGKIVQILSFRRQVAHNSATAPLQDSRILSVRVPLQSDYNWNDSGAPQYRTVGWELNARNKPGPRWVNLKPLLDTNHLSIQAADLNLKLMKWRMIPDLDVEMLSSTKVLIIGAGTLGCSVARVLLGWGVRKFKFVDYGNVSYSNPVRQSLFIMEDCHGDKGGGRSKAVAAADALKSIAADVESEGIVLSIPMPGHSDTAEAIQQATDTLDALVQECDVVYLLTDTRESRWLPTVMAARYNKPLINAALGLDSWLVMRHGGDVSQESNTHGCYFCNDIVAPENSTKNRTLDQQCTVTRPGLAPIAASMAVEMMVAMMHHPQKQAAPAPRQGSTFGQTVTNSDGSNTGALGAIPHQVRGSLMSFTMMCPSVPAFKHCTGCSPAIVNAYKNDQIGTVVGSCQALDSSYLEGLSDDTTGQRVLIIGNSYIRRNGLTVMVQSILGDTAQVVQYARPSKGLYQHWQGVQKNSASELALLFDQEWDWIVMQDSSLNPVQLLEATWNIVTSFVIQRIVESTSSKNYALFQTWGRRDGWKQFSFLTMSHQVYERYQSAAYYVEENSDDGKVYVAPVGRAFESVYNGSDVPFASLYHLDGSHPSSRGTYLAACCIAGTIMSPTSQDLSQNDFVPKRMNATTAATLREVATRILIQEGTFAATPSPCTQVGMSCGVEQSCCEASTCIQRTCLARKKAPSTSKEDSKLFGEDNQRGYLTRKLKGMW